jgi:hypothetical protein
MAISRAELAIMCHEKLFSDNPEITQVNAYIARLKNTTNKVKKGVISNGNY